MHFCSQSAKGWNPRSKVWSENETDYLKYAAAWKLRLTSSKSSKFLTAWNWAKATAFNNSRKAKSKQQPSCLCSKATAQQRMRQEKKKQPNWDLQTLRWIDSTTRWTKWKGWWRSWSKEMTSAPRRWIRCRDPSLERKGARFIRMSWMNQWKNKNSQILNAKDKSTTSQKTLRDNHKSFQILHLSSKALWKPTTHNLQFEIHNCRFYKDQSKIFRNWKAPWYPGWRTSPRKTGKLMLLFSTILTRRREIWTCSWVEWKATSLVSTCLRLMYSHPSKIRICCRILRSYLMLSCNRWREGSVLTELMKLPRGIRHWEIKIKLDT